MKKFFLVTLLLVGASIGCESGSTSDSAKSASTNTPTGSQFIASSEPAGSVGVGEARTNSTDGSDIVVVGHVGGSAAPFVEGVAAFSIVDTSVPYCQPEEGCPTPWDYCCTQDQVQTNIATIKIVDTNGKLINEDARKLLGVKELSLVVVEGQARRDEAGNLTVLAKKVFIRSQK